MTRQVVVLGAGIVGTAVADQLGRRAGCSVTVVDRRGPDRLPGSTGHAPGFVGILNAEPTLVALARESVEIYRNLEWRGQAGFDQVGAVELATSRAGAERLTVRAQAAVTAGIPATLIDPADAVALAPRMIDHQGIVAALQLPWDGAARAKVITAALAERAEAAGARFLFGRPATAIEIRGDRVVGVQVGDERLPADDVVVACGIWGPAIADLAGIELPLVPVVHAYVYSAAHPATRRPSPLIRWPEHNVYARDDGSRYGLGTSDHAPLIADELADRAELSWPGGEFDDAVAAALKLLPAEHRWSPSEHLGGVLAITPDKMPLLGSLGQVDGLWSAEAIWVTHAAGAAKALVAQMFGEPSTIAPLDPERFTGSSPEDLRQQAAARYRDQPPPA